MTNEEQLSPNMNEELLGDIFKALPETLDDGELCALTLSIYSAYIDDPSKVLSELLGLVYTFGLSTGVSRKTISAGLRMMADLQDAEMDKAP